MVTLAVYAIVLLVVGRLWLRWRPGPGRARATAPPEGSSSSRPRTRRSVPVDTGVPPLTEDDMIAFGLVLEGTSDVVSSALWPQDAPAEPQRRRDVAGPS